MRRAGRDKIALVDKKENDMAPEELLTILRERPFQPIRIALTDGRSFEVRHPEMVLAGRRSAVIGLPAQGETEPLYDRRITVDLLHIVSVEPIQTPAKPNGQT
jgi:hypothetical protein